MGSPEKTLLLENRYGTSGILIYHATIQYIMSVVYAVVVCPSVCPCVTRRCCTKTTLNVGSHKQRPWTLVC